MIEAEVVEFFMYFCINILTDKIQKIMKKIITVVVAACFALTSYAWGKKGHDVTASIAERHLTPEARALVDSLLDGRSMIYWANWLDNASYSPQYGYTKTWHYKNVNKGVRYEEMDVNPAGDAVTAIKAQMETLSSPIRSAKDKELALKILIHVMGDIHQPMHMGRATDLGGNRIKVKFFDRDTNLHSVWDDSLPEAAHKWSYTEWTDQIDRLKPNQEESIIYVGEGITPGGAYIPKMVDEWAKEAVVIADRIYECMPEKKSIRYDEIAWSTPIIEQQLLAAGLRLAFLLNHIAAQQP